MRLGIEVEGKWCGEVLTLPTDHESQASWDTKLPLTHRTMCTSDLGCIVKEYVTSCRH